MALIRLSPRWTRLMESYRADHQNPYNQACHTVGIPLIAASIPVGATVVGLPLATAMFTTGWGFQLVGHAFEGKKPSFVDDRRAFLCGFFWWTQKVGIPLVEERARADA